MPKARESVMVRTAEDLGRALGLSTAVTAEMEFRSELTAALAKIISSRAAHPCRNRLERRNVKNASDRNCERQHQWHINDVLIRILTATGHRAEVRVKNSAA
jgi:hypothetical protein